MPTANRSAAPRPPRRGSSSSGLCWPRRALARERYGRFGGIAYYHVSDLDVAPFSRFIPCGAYAGVYILDPLWKNKSDIQPDTVHADTHSQSAAIFGLVYMLGIAVDAQHHRVNRRPPGVGSEMGQKCRNRCHTPVQL